MRTNLIKVDWMNTLFVSKGLIGNLLVNVGYIVLGLCKPKFLSDNARLSRPHINCFCRNPPTLSFLYIALQLAYYTVGHILLHSTTFYSRYEGIHTLPHYTITSASTSDIYQSPWLVQAA
jgi:hypothetical protein